MGDLVYHLRAEFLKALGSPLRLKILTALRDGEKNVCELMDALDLCHSTVSCNCEEMKKALEAL